MTYTDCCTPSPPRRGGRAGRFTRRLARVLAPPLMVAALGCREDSESPTAPEPGPALDITPAHVLSFSQVSAGGFHTCGVTLNNRAYCWGGQCRWATRQRHEHGARDMCLRPCL